MTDLLNLSVKELLKLHSDIGQELWARSIIRSANNPAGDLAEYLFCKAFGWDQAGNSEKGYDAVDTGRVRYQIKSVRMHRRRKSRQVSSLRNLDRRPFDVLAGVLFNEDYTVRRAALVPIETVEMNVSNSKHTNSHIFHLRDAIWDDPGVTDVTKRLVEVVL
jgi:hypothetical protein